MSFDIGPRYVCEFSAGNDQRQLAKRHGRLALAFQDAHHESRCLLAGFKHVYVRVSVVADNGVSFAHHALRDVGMQIQRHHDGPFPSQHLSRNGQDEAFHVVLAFRCLCSVHGQQPRVRRAFRSPSSNALSQLFEIRTQQPVRRDRPRRADRCEFYLCAVQHIQKTAHFGQFAAMPLQHGLAKNGCEILIPRINGEKVLLSCNIDAIAIRNKVSGSSEY